MMPGRGEFVQLLDATAPGSDLFLFGLSNQQLTDVVHRFSEPPYRARQLADGLYRRWYDDLAAFSSLPKELRQRLSEAGYSVGSPRIQQTFRSSDGTERYLVACGDGQTVETVWMPDGDGGEAGDGSEEAGDLAHNPAEAQREPDSRPAARRATICVSSQIGCAVSCRFCLTARLGLARSLTAGEIAGQVVAVLRRQGVVVGRDRINLVFMGMGEPFLNYDAFMAAVRLLVEEVGLAESRMTVSTSGIVPGILRFAEEKIRPRLAISLNAPSNEVREQIMPVNRKWPIEAILDAVRQVPLRPRERVTFEYVLLGGVTDRPEHAGQVARLLRRTNLPLKVNLIAWNPGPDAAFSMPDAAAVERFRQQLVDAGIPAYVRRPRGRDIYAACGQLKRTVETV